MLVAYLLLLPSAFAASLRPPPGADPGRRRSSPARSAGRWAPNFAGLGGASGRPGCRGTYTAPWQRISVPRAGQAVGAAR